jgi:hypothetical protein
VSMWGNRNHGPFSATLSPSQCNCYAKKNLCRTGIYKCSKCIENTTFFTSNNIVHVKVYWENDIVLSRFYLWHNYQLVEGGQYFAQEVVIVVSVVDWILCIFHVFNRLDIPSGQIPIRYQMLGLKTKLEFDGRMCNEMQQLYLE